MCSTTYDIRSDSYWLIIYEKISCFKTSVIKTDGYDLKAAQRIGKILSMRVRVGRGVALTKNMKKEKRREEHLSRCCCAMCAAREMFPLCRQSIYENKIGNIIFIRCSWHRRLRLLLLHHSHTHPIRCRCCCPCRFTFIARASSPDCRIARDRRHRAAVKIRQNTINQFIISVQLIFVLLQKFRRVSPFVFLFVVFSSRSFFSILLLFSCVSMATRNTPRYTYYGVL